MKRNHWITFGASTGLILVAVVLVMVGLSHQPRASVEPTVEAPAAAPAVDPAPASDIRFGLTEAKRREVWLEISRADRLGNEEAERQIPMIGRTDVTPEKALAAARLSREVAWEEYDRIAERHGFPRDLIGHIAKESMDKNWPHAQ